MSFKPNRRFESELERETAIRAYVLRRAEEAAVHTRAAAPSHTGYYKRHVEVHPTEKGARVASTDPAGNLIEWGSVNNIAYGPLRKGAELSGAHYVDTGRP